MGPSPHGGSRRGDLAFTVSRTGAGYGADTDQLLSFAEIVKGAGTRIGDLTQELLTSASTLEWTGPDAEQFRGELESQIAVDLHALGGRCEAIARGCGRDGLGHVILKSR